jgi:exo-beta-1,3-glucanase (GH17 family)
MLTLATSLALLICGAAALPSASPAIITTNTERASSCYPALDFQAPSTLPKDTSSWWCDDSTEYAFMGFSYEVSDCQSVSTMKSDFYKARHTFNSRYIRLYGVCDRKNFYDDVVTAAWYAQVGVHALIWFGFDGTDEWKGRRDALFHTLHTNSLAKFVTRVVQFGSEPLYDWVLPIDDLTKQVVSAKKNLSSLGIPVTVSELAYGYQETDDSQELLDVIDSINIHMLPFFAFDASTAKNSWPLVQRDLDWFIDHGDGKKMYFDENGWPSRTSEGVQNNSIYAVANVANERDYYQLLDSKCEYLKGVVGGGVGWFWHIWSDDQEPGYGLFFTNGTQKFSFTPRTHC